MYTCKKLLVLSLALFLSIPLLITLMPSSSLAASTQAQVVEAARQEGALNWVDSIIVPSSAKVIAAAFRKHYGLPEDFKVNHQRLGTRPLSSRVAEEVTNDRAAGIGN